MLGVGTAVGHEGERQSGILPVLVSCVPLGKFLILSVAQFPPL